MSSAPRFCFGVEETPSLICICAQKVQLFLPVLLVFSCSDLVGQSYLALVFLGCRSGPFTSCSHGTSEVFSLNVMMERSVMCLWTTHILNSLDPAPPVTLTVGSAPPSKCPAVSGAPPSPRPLSSHPLHTVKGSN